MNPIRHGPVEIRLNDDGSLDELVLHDEVTGLFARLEQLDRGCWHCLVGHNIGKTVSVHLTSSRKITATWEKS